MTYFSFERSLIAFRIYVRVRSDVPNFENQLNSVYLHKSYG